MIAKLFWSCTASVCLVATAFAQECEPQRWVEQDPVSGDRLGAAVAIDGDTAVVGELQLVSGSNNDTGAVHIFTRRPTGWTRDLYLTPEFTYGDSFFGSALAMQGTLLAVGAQAKDGPFQESGAVLLYQGAGPNWTQIAELQPNVMNHGERRFGTFIQIEGDRMLIGATGYDGVVEESGAVFVYEKRAGVWTETARLVADDGALNNFFGTAGWLYGDYAFIGSPLANGASFKSGAIYVFSKTSGVWLQTAKVSPADLVNSAALGGSFSMSGNKLAVGASRQAGPLVTSGAVYLFDFEAGALVWDQTIFPSDPGSGWLFGRSVALHNDRLIVGSPDAGEVQDGPPGTVEAFRYQQGSWVSEGPVESPDSGARTGEAIAMDRETLIWSALTETTSVPLAGAVYFDQVVHGQATTYCDLTPNSSGPGASISVNGSLGIVSNNLQLSTTGGVPNAFGIFLYGGGAGSTPYGNGTLCVSSGAAGIFYLVPATLTGSNGDLSLQPDLSIPPFDSGPGMISVGSTWYFQSLYRDVYAPGSGWNLSNALQIRFCY